jgi:hypothetical protein
MSTLTFSTLQAHSGAVIKVPYGQVFDVKGNIRIPSWTNSTRPSGVVGMFGYNTEVGSLEFYGTGGWRSAGTVLRDGSSQDAAAENGYTLKRDNPSLSNGRYWIKNERMPNPLEMWVDMSEDGGGYDYLPLSGATNVSSITDNHSGISLGLDLWEGRSIGCWRGATRAVNNFDSSNFNSYWEGVGHVYKSAGGGNYTGCIMRSFDYGGSNCDDWRVLTGGKWWIRDSTHSEPNGDYSANGFQRIYGGSRPSLGSVSTSMGFNDGGAYAIGTRYIVSTNAKP